MRLELKDVKKSYGKKTVLPGITITFEPGIYGFLGPNGAGKSTTIRMLCTVDKPNAGEILCDGKDIFEMGGEFRERIGYVPQKAGYYPDFTADMFLRYIAALKGVAEERQRIEECLRLVDLWEKRKKKVKELSGGMKQRLNIAQALLNNPQILILDEPTVGLDPDERIRLKNFLHDLSEDKIVIFATHIVSDVEDIADRVVILKDGKIKLNEDIENAMQMAGEKVWRCDLDNIDEIKRIREHYKVSRVWRHKGSVSMRVVSEQKPCEDAIEVEGSLEEVYLRMVG